MATPAAQPIAPRPGSGIYLRLFERIEGGKLDLPLLPAVAGKVYVETGREDCDARKLANVIRTDAAMAGHLLRVANSPLYLPRVPIVSLQQAISLLGMKRIREMAIIISCETRVFQVKGFEAEVRTMFRHSLAAALFAQEIARQRRANVEEAFLCGLLHDVGRPALLQALVDLHKEERCPVDRAAAMTLIDEHHARVGGLMVSSWALPGRLGETIAHHHDPQPPQALAHAAWTIAVADELARFALAAAPLDEGALATATERVRTLPANALLNLYPEHIDVLLGRRQAIAGMIGAMG